MAQSNSSGIKHTFPYYAGFMHFAEMVSWDDSVSSLDAICMAVINIIREFTTHEAGVAAALFLHKCGHVTWCAATLALDSLQLFFLCIASYNSPNVTADATGHIQAIDLMTPTLLFKVLKSLFLQYSHPLLTCITRESPTWIPHRMCRESFQN
jgi:hypothetical protein